MDDKQLDQWFQEGLGEWEAPASGVDANWDRLQHRMQHRRRRRGFWLWGIGLLLGCMGLSWGWGLWPSQSQPTDLQVEQQVEQATDPDLTASLASGSVSQASQSDSANQKREADSPAPSTPPQVRHAHTQTGAHASNPMVVHVPAAEPLARRRLASQDQRIRQATSSPKGMDAVNQQLVQEVIPSTVKAVGQIGIRAIPPLSLLPSSSLQNLRQTATARIDPVDQKPRWRWFTHVGLSGGWQRSQPQPNRLTPWPFAVEVIWVERGPWALHAAWQTDRYRIGDAFENRSLLSGLRFTQTDNEVAASPPEAPPSDTTRSLVIDAPGWLLPLSLRYTPQVPGRWHPFMQGGIMLRYQRDANLLYRYETPEMGPVSEEDITTSVQEEAPSGGPSPMVRGWHWAGWQVAAGLQVNLRPHVAMQLAGYYQSRAALSLPEQTPFQQVGIRATFWWKR